MGIEKAVRDHERNRWLPVSWQDDEPCGECGSPTGKPPQQNFDVRPMLRYRVRCTGEQARKVLSKLTALLRQDAHEQRIRSVTLGSSGPVGLNSKAWALVFEVTPELRAEVSGFLVTLGLEQEE